MKKNFIIFTIITLIILGLATDYVFADTFNENLIKTAEQTGHSTERKIEGIIQIIIKAVLSFLGVGFLLLMIYGGYTWMIAKGNEQDVTKAKSIITNAIIGLIVVLLAYAISYLVISKFVSPPTKQQTEIKAE